MISFKRTGLITIKDLRESINNRVILVAILLPLFASLLFSVLNNPGIPRDFRVAVGSGEELADFLKSSYLNLEVESFPDFNSGLASVKDGVNEALIYEKTDGSYRVYIDNQTPVTYLFLKDTIYDLLLEYEGEEPAINMEVTAVNTPETKLSLLPTWIMITVTMIGVMILSGSLAEEKENGTLDAIRITPTRKEEILLGKVIFGVVISTLTIFLMLLFNNFYFHPLLFILTVVFVILASFCFSTLGLLIGTLASSQSAARSLGTIIYFPLVFPALIHELSGITGLMARFFPTYYFLRGLEKLLINKLSIGEIMSEMIYLLLFTFIFSVLTYFCFKRVIQNE